MQDERTCGGDNLTTSERDSDRLWTIQGVLDQWFEGATLEAMGGKGIESAAGQSAYLLSDATESEKLLASQLGRLIWRFDASRYDGDFGDCAAAWEYPALEMDADTVMDEVPVWRNPEAWQPQPIPHADVLENQRKAVTKNLDLVRREIKLTEEWLEFLAAGAGTVSPLAVERGWKAYSAAGGPVLPASMGGGIQRERFGTRDASTAKDSREGILLMAGLPAGDPGIEVIAAQARDILRFKKAEEVFLVWLSGFEGPMAHLSDCNFRRLRPWRALIEEAGYGDMLPGRRIKSDPALACPVSEAHLEDLVARLLAPDGGALINRFETAVYWLDGAKARFDEIRRRVAAGEDVDAFRPPPAPSVHTAIRRAGQPAPSTVRASEIAELRDCVPALGSASHPEFEIPLGSVVIGVPGEPAYLRGDGWCVSPKGNL